MFAVDDKPAPLEKYPHVIKLPVVWGDMDGMNHVNNTRYFRYQETARIEMIGALLDGLDDPATSDPAEGIALAETRCRFKVSLTYPDQIYVGSGIARIDEFQFLIQHEIYSEKMQCIAAEGDARMVAFDFTKNRKRLIEGQHLENLQRSLVRPE